MRKILIAAVAIILAIGGGSPAIAKKPSGSTSSTHGSSSAPKVHVRGYTRKDGTYVAPHDRAYPGSGSHSQAPKTLGTVPRQNLPPTASGSTGRTITPYSSRSHSLPGVQRDAHGRFKRSEAARDAFKRLHPCPSTGRTGGPCLGFVIDHIVPLCASGPDATYNMQWQTAEQAQEKDRWEKKECNAFRRR